jgi:hypothetical protein
MDGKYTKLFFTDKFFLFDTAVNGRKDKKLPPLIVEKGKKELKYPPKPLLFLRFIYFTFWQRN